MRQEKVSTLTEIFTQGTLGNLHERSCLVTQLETLLSFYLDSRLRQLVKIAAYQNGNLILACTNSTAATHFRYLNRVYIQQLRQHHEFCELQYIRTVVLSSTPTHSMKMTQAPLEKLSPTTARLLTSLANELGEGEISEALRRLARHSAPSEKAEGQCSSNTKKTT